MNKWKIYFLFFGFALCFGLFGILNKNALAVESYKISPEQDRTLKRDFYSSLNISDSKNIDMHYYFYAKNNYNEYINVIAYVCEYKPNYFAEDVKTISDCGLSMVQEAGKFKIKLKASAYKLLSYSRRTQKVSEAYVQVEIIYSYENSTKDIASFTDQDFEKGLTLLGGSTILKNEWNRNEGGFLVDPVGGSSSGSNNNQNQNNNSGGGFNLDILGGIKGFFQPMIDSIVITNDFFINSINNIKDFILNFFVKLFEEFGKFVKWVFVPESDVLTKQIKSFTDLIDLSFQPLKQTLGIDFVDPMYLNTNRCNGSPSGLTGNGDGRFSGMNGFPAVIEINICKVPKPLIFLARNLFRFSVIFVLLHRLSITLPIVLGSRYVWERSEKGDDK